jgi:hypothetical protein
MDGQRARRTIRRHEAAQFLAQLTGLLGQLP